MNTRSFIIAFAIALAGTAAISACSSTSPQVTAGGDVRPEPKPTPGPRPVPEPRPGPTDTGDPAPKPPAK